MKTAPDGVLKGDLSIMMNFFWAPLEFKFAISVAAVCCKVLPGNTPECNAQYVQSVLERVFDHSDLEPQVTPMTLLCAWCSSSACSTPNMCSGATASSLTTVVLRVRRK